MPADPREELHLEMTGGAPAVRHALEQTMADRILTGLSDSLRQNTEIVLAEVLNNIVEHAYCGTTGPIRIWLRREGATGLACRIEDQGGPLPGSVVPQSDLPEAGSLAEGGFGWFLIRSLASGLEYRRQGDVNCLSFRLDEEQSAR